MYYNNNNNNNKNVQIVNFDIKESPVLLCNTVDYSYDAWLSNDYRSESAYQTPCNDSKHSFPSHHNLAEAYTGQ